MFRGLTEAFRLFFSPLVFLQEGLDTARVVSPVPSPEPLNMGWLLVKTAAFLILIVALILVSVYLLKKYVFGASAFGKNAEWIQVLGQIQIQPKKYLALVRVLDKVLLVGFSDSTMQTLTEFDDPEKIQPFLDRLEQQPSAWSEGRFLEIFKKNLQRK